MKIAITGASGFIGSSLIPSLITSGHEVHPMVRSQQKSTAGTIFWNPDTAYVNTPALEGINAVIHLSGEPITGRWNPAKKDRIRNSRVRGTRLLSEALCQARKPPQLLISASAIGYYGDRDDHWLTENSDPGAGFLADTCVEWELATEAAQRHNIRVVMLRMGLILSTKGGALAQMLPPFKMGVGGKLGSGKQYMSWIVLDDLIAIVHHLLATETIAGPVNAVSPNPVTNREFTKTLAKVLGRPAIFPVPAFAVRLMFGQMGDEVVLAGARIKPDRLLHSGFHFHFAELEPGLRHLLPA
ncbi:MAG: TIGR01777 family protein [Acidobacteria bacterium RIFCSPLOWO2_12_FULL_54_10]|nr:MAG: TIGR01777 family protein [Acidobacteria bacterium RIFCSPLOWO2_12_FULL_54_10]